jgi:hypothetical protein
MSLKLFKQWIIESQQRNPQKFGKIRSAFESIFESTEDVVQNTKDKLSSIPNDLDSIDDILGNINLEPDLDESPDIDLDAILGGDGFGESEEEPIEEGFSD